MALDAAMLRYTANELKQELVGARVDKLYMPARDEVVFNLRTPSDGPKRLICNARSGTARVHLTKEDFENPQTPPAFCMLLRKHIGSGRVLDVFALEGDRVLFIDFEAINELGDRVTVRLSVELMGRYSNLVLVDANNVVIDALKRIDESQSDKRQLVPGAPFTMPPAQNKLPFFSTGSEAMVAAACESSKPLSDALLSAVAGIGPALCRQAAFLTSRDDPSADALSAEQRAKLAQVLYHIKAAANGEGAQPATVYEGEKPVEFSFVPLTHYEGCEIRPFATASELLDAYYSERDREQRMKSRSHDLKKQVNTILERTIRRQASRAEELQSTDKAERKKLFGELLTANLGQIQKGDATARVLDYYSGEEVVIPLDIRLTPNQNAQKYYRDYRKLVTASTILAELLEQGEHEIKYLESVVYAIDCARTDADFLAIRAELKQAGYLRSFKMPKQKPQKTDAFLHYETPDGFRIVVGRNNTANERLTMKLADKHDVWFHVKVAAGSHTVLITEGNTPSDEAYTTAAAIAALNSSVADGAQVAVDYTEVKNVKKPPGSKAGMVTYDKYYTAYVTPDRAALEAMRK